MLAYGKVVGMSMPMKIVYVQDSLFTKDNAFIHDRQALKAARA